MRAWVAVGVLVLSPSLPRAAAQSDEVKQLRQEVASLKASVAALQKEVASMKGVAPAAKKPNFTARVSAASSLTSTNDYQAAFAKIAVESAAWGEVKICNDAIGRLTSSNVQQECLYKAALRLAALGMEDDAITLAKQLTSSNEQQKALLKIARGETDDKP